MNKDQKPLEEAYKLVSEKKELLYNIDTDGSVIWIGKGPDLTGSPEVVEGGFSCGQNRRLKSLKGGPKTVKGEYYYCFDCSLESLEGAPEIIDGHFFCGDNKLLKTLKGSPRVVGGDYSCYKCCNLKSLKGGPKVVKRDYSCANCDIESLEGAPEVVGSRFFCGNNKLLKTLKGGPKIVKGYYSCYNCNLESLEGAPEVVGGDFDCFDNPLKSLRGTPKAGRYILPKGFTDADVKKELKRQEREKLLNTIDKDTKDTFGDLIRNI